MEPISGQVGSENMTSVRLEAVERTWHGQKGLDHPHKMSE